MSDIGELIARLEALNGPDSQLEKDILRHFGFTWRGMNYWNNDGQMWLGPTLFTHSIDAVLALVERLLPGAFWLLSRGRLSAAEPEYGAQLLFGSDEVIGDGEGPTAPLATLLALLRALPEKDGR